MGKSQSLNKKTKKPNKPFSILQIQYTVKKKLNLIQEKRNLFYIECWLSFHLKYQGIYFWSLNNDKEMLTFVIIIWRLPVQSDDFRGKTIWNKFW